MLSLFYLFWFKLLNLIYTGNVFPNKYFLIQRACIERIYDFRV